MYNGKFILRFDDTNPENAKLNFYEAQKKDLNWLGIEWDVEYNTSNNLKIHYKLLLIILQLNMGGFVDHWVKLVFLLLAHAFLKII